MPADWTWVILLAVGSQVIGQGLLVYAIGALSPLVVGLVLLTQPAISAVVGWFAYGERLRPIDWLGALAIGAALVLVRLPERGLPPSADQRGQLPWTSQLRPVPSRCCTQTPVFRLPPKLWKTNC